MTVLRPFLPVTLAALAALPLASVGHAQQKATLWDLFSPDRIVARLIQTGIMSLRTQFEVVYGNISASALSGSVTVTDITAWPRVDWEVVDACRVDLERLVLRTVPLDELDLIRIKVQVTGATVSFDCLPPEVRAGAVPLDLGNSISVPRMTLDMDYRISTSALTTHFHAVAADLAAISLDTDFGYVWVDASQAMVDPEPVLVLSSARMTLENLGAWEKLSPMIPPEMLDEAQIPGLVSAFLDGMLGTPAPGESPSPEREALAASAQEAVAGFLADPRRIVLETGFDPAEPQFLDLKSWDLTPETILSDLQPRLALRPQSARDVLPASLITTALETPDQLSDEDRLRVGTALATGIGAPRDLAAAESLLAEAAGDGSGEAALALARAVEARDPGKAYTLALRAAESGTQGAAGTLDRIEAALPFATVLELQAALVEGVEHPVDALDQLTSVRSEAAMRMSGNGRSRSYATAALWALIGAAAGDAESADILAEIDERVRLAGPEAAGVWAAQEANAVELARSAWLGFDLPSSFGGAD